MKKQLFALLLGLLLTTASAYAQTTNVTEGRCSFEFVVAGRTMPKSEYTIRTLDGIDHALSIRGEGQKPSIFLANSCVSLKSVQRSSFSIAMAISIFSPRSGRREIDAGDHQLARSRRELEMARNDTVERLVVLAELR